MGGRVCRADRWLGRVGGEVMHQRGEEGSDRRKGLRWRRGAETAMPKAGTNQGLPQAQHRDGMRRRPGQPCKRAEQVLAVQIPACR